FGVALQRYANGIDERKVAMPGATRSISRETTFAEDTMDRVFLRSTLHYLCERVGAELRQQQRQARCVTLKLRYYDFETISRSSTLAEPTDVDQLVFQRALALFEKALSQRKEAIRLIGVEASHLAGHGRQLHMFDGNDEKLARLNETVDRIRRKYGFTSIQTGRTFTLREVFAEDERDFHLHTPSLFGPMRPSISRPAKCSGDADST
ncbi:MAG: hypothetical protein QGI09_04660, partial [Dehalococcoidia bacterium]|nr:hypothetical protein [Dehalococcoidia bacterium]